MLLEELRAAGGGIVAPPVPRRRHGRGAAFTPLHRPNIAACAHPPGSRPGRTPAEISRGQVRASGRRPRKPWRVARCPSGASKKWPGTSTDRWRPNRPEATSGGGDAAGRPTPKTSPMPRWGMARSARPPGAAPAAAGLPPANFRRRPSGPKSQASATLLRGPDSCRRNGKPPANSSPPIPLPQIPRPNSGVLSSGCVPRRRLPGSRAATGTVRLRFGCGLRRAVQPCKSLARREDFSRRAAGCAAHPVTPAGAPGRKSP